MARALLISHEPEAAPALIGRAFAARGFEIDHHVVLAGADAPDVDFPNPAEYDVVVAFGSFAHAYDETAQTWVRPEVELLSSIVRDDVPYLGVCFGGQLLARVLGGDVERAPDDEHEIGLVTFDDDAALPIPPGPWFTWHEDRVVLPDDVAVLAHNGKAVQLFRAGRAVGTQFHPEADHAVVDSWVRMGPDHIPGHSSGAQLLQDVEVHEARLRRNCEDLVDWFLRDVAGLADTGAER